MKKLIIRIIVAALAVATLSCLASCSTWTTPYDRLDKDGYTVSVKFDVGEGATFANVANVSIVDVFNMEDFEINSSGEYEIPIIKPDDKARENAFTPARSGYILAGWYTERTLRTDSNGNMLDEYGSITTDPAKQGYIYNNLWDFESDTLKVTASDFTSSEPALTLYAAWIPKFTYQFYEQGASEPYGSVEKTNLSFPEWRNGKMDLNDFPGISGKTFQNAYIDEACTLPVTAEYLDGVDYEHGVIKNPVTNIYTTWREGTWYKIETLKDFTSNISVVGNYELLCDLDFQGKTWPKALQRAAFSGSIIGNGHKISNITVTQTDLDWTKYGVFGAIESGAKISDVVFENITFRIQNGSRVQGSAFGLFAGAISSEATIQNVSLSGSLEIMQSAVEDGMLSVSKNHTLGLVVGGETPAALSSASVKCYLVKADNTKTEVAAGASGIVDINGLKQ